MRRSSAYLGGREPGTKPAVAADEMWPLKTYIVSAAVVGLLVTAGCEANVSVAQKTPAPTPPSGPSAPEPPGAERPVVRVPSEPAFDPTTDSVRMLPFRVRLQKLADVVGVPVDAPMFDRLRELRLDLGDYDFAKGVSPDLSWTSRKMALWIDGLLPVCDSAEMKQRYPDWEDALPSFVLRAHGRPLQPDDSAIVQQALTEAPIPAALQHRTLCVGLLSSAEFLVQ